MQPLLQLLVDSARDAGSIPADLGFTVLPKIGTLAKTVKIETRVPFEPGRSSGGSMPPSALFVARVDRTPVLRDDSGVTRQLAKWRVEMTTEPQPTPNAQPTSGQIPPTPAQVPIAAPSGTPAAVPQIYRPPYPIELIEKSDQSQASGHPLLESLQKRPSGQEIRKPQQ